MSGVDWRTAWEPVLAAIGQELGDGRTIWGADRIEAGAIRRFLEPLEFDCPLHEAADAARGYGHPDISAPYTAMLTFALPAMRKSAERLFASDARDAQPVRTATRPELPDFFPPFAEFFATEIEWDFLRPAYLGERLGMRGKRLVACKVRETRVGRGAFVTIGTEIVEEDGDVLAHLRSGMFCYDSLPATPC